MVLIGGIAHHPFGHPTTVALVPATFLGPSMPGPVPSAHPVFRRIACLPILPAAAVPAVVCHSADSIDFAPADSVVAAVVAAVAAAVAAAIVVATDSAWTAVVAFDFVVIAGSVGSADFAGTAAGSVV